MKAFEFFNDFGNVDFPNDCQFIWNALLNMGRINFSKRLLAKYYSDYCFEIYYEHWIDPVGDPCYVEDFAE